MHQLGMRCFGISEHASANVSAIAVHPDLNPPQSNLVPTTGHLKLDLDDCVKTGVCYSKQLA